jgi:hypothetical protein
MPLSELPSWYPDKEYPEGIEKYLRWIEEIFQVQYADGRWDFIKLTPHQREFHSRDIGLMHECAVSEMDEKSRNTSFTISSIIRLLMGNYYFRDEIVPLVRINDLKVKELIKEFKKIIKHMRPKRFPNGDMFPFDPNKVNLGNAGMIEFKDVGVTFQGYPASASAAESVRGLRITRGLFDEINFSAKFNEINIAMRDASRGVMSDGKKYFQLTYGTTWKGETPAKIWVDKIKRLNLTNWQVFSWPVYNPEKFDKDVPPIQQNLQTIVPWHSNEDLNNKWLENLKSFLEEYMCICTPSDEALYNIEKVMSRINTELISSMDFNEDDEYYIGCDPAGMGGDMFTISVFAKRDNKMVQKYLFYKSGVELDEMERFCKVLIEKTMPAKFVVDGNGIGYQLSSTLKKQYPRIVEIIRGSRSIKIEGRQTIPFKEYMHTNHLKMINLGEVELLNDDEQIYHYTQWKNNYEAEHSDRGHGDIVIANCLALLPSNWQKAGRKYNAGSTPDEIKLDEDEVKEEVKKFNSPSAIKERMDFFKYKKSIF